MSSFGENIDRENWHYGRKADQLTNPGNGIPCMCSVQGAIAISWANIME